MLETVRQFANRRLADDPDETPAALKGLFWARDFARRTDHGAVGYPEFADPERGRRMIDAIVANGEPAEHRETLRRLFRTMVQRARDARVAERTQEPGEDPRDDAEAKPSPDGR